MILGYILTMVYITLEGNVQGKTLNYYNIVEKCYADALNLKMDAKPGVGFVCLEDYIDVEK